MKPLPPIPIPLALRWREFRIRVLPAAVFAAGVVVSAWIWNQHLSAPSLVGEVETRRAHVTSIQPGLVTKLNVDCFEEVQAGDPVAEVLVCDPKYLESVIGVVKAESAVLRLQLDPMVTHERVKVDFERLRLDLLDQKVQLASAQIQLRYAEAEYERVIALRTGEDGVASQSDLEIALRDRDSLSADIMTRSNLVQEIEAALAPLHVSRPLPQDSLLPEGWRVALELQEQQLKQALAEFGPVTLLAPIAGTVSTVYRRSGENVAAGEPIVTITSTRSARIQAYLLPGWRVEPKVGMAVEVRSRSGAREFGRGRVTYVGGHMDLITSSLLASANPQSANTAPQIAMQPTWQGGQPLPIGLPLAVSVPETLRLLPGEQVDLRLLEGDVVPSDPAPLN